MSLQVSKNCECGRPINRQKHTKMCEACYKRLVRRRKNPLVGTRKSKGGVIRYSIEGTKIGRWTVGKPIHGNKKLGQQLKYECICECGNARVVESLNLRHNKSLSCGCLRRELFQLRQFESLFNRAKRDAQRRGLSFTLTFKQFENLTLITECHYCGDPITWMKQGTKDRKWKYLGATNLDRKDNTKGYTKQNVVVCCTRCNRAKSNTFSYDEFVVIGQAIKLYNKGRRANSSSTIELFSGRQFDLIHPKPDQITIEDIAKGMRSIPRYNGQTSKQYFVGDHCVLMARLFLDKGQVELAKYALLHDSQETVYQDIIKNLKYLKEMTMYRLLEKRGQAMIYKKFGLHEKEPLEVKQMDTLLTNNEKRDLRPHTKLPKNTKFYPDVTITPWGSEKTEREFLKMYNELFGEEFGEVEIP
jgi:hypothetical protein